jgi:predicted metal-dependent phosphoesterase TrpH
MLKVELHTHTADDPLDRIPHSTGELIEAAAREGYDALAVTLHDRQLDLRPWAGLARELRIVLIPGVERTIQGKHVLLLNYPPIAERVTSFDDVRRLKERFAGLVVAPHALYPTKTCLGRGLLDRHADLFDAVEFTYFYTRGSRLFNDRAARWAEARGLPLVGNGDVHRLRQLGKTFSLVDAEPSVDGILQAIRAGRVKIRSKPISMAEAASYMGSLFWAEWSRAWRGQDTATEPLAAE